MAPPELDAGESNSKSKICKKCKNTVVNDQKCIVCNSSFHRSCAKNSSSVKIIDTEKVLCCDDLTLTNGSELDGSEIQFTDTLKNLSTDGKIDINIFNYIVMQKNALIRQLLETVEILKHQIGIHKKIDETSINNKENKKKLKSDSSQRPDVNISPKISLESNVARPQKNREYLENKNVSENRVKQALWEANTKLKCDEYINLTNKTDDNNGKEETFTKVVHRRRKLGEGNGQLGFHGKQENANKKIWLFISKIPDSVSETNIKEYIETKAETADVCVKSLPTRNQRKNNQSFMVGVSPNLKEEIYDAKFWPKNVLYERFNFKIGHRFLDNQKMESTSKSDKQQPESFFQRRGQEGKTSS